MMESPLFLFDAGYRAAHGVFCGVDEAGRGPLAGPVCAGCVVLPAGLELAGLNDSKKLTEKRREALFEQLTCDKSVCWGVGWASPAEIDDVNILQATFLAMSRACVDMRSRFPACAPEIALVDGNRPPPLALPVETLVDGDAKSASVAAASVIAKVSRDRLMKELAEQYPQYQFEKHKGYPTKLHYAMIEQYGISEIHRRSFLKGWRP